MEKKSYQGNLRKMDTVYTDLVGYNLRLPDLEKKKDGEADIPEENVAMNELVGNKVTLQYEGRINCVRCGRETKKSFSQGFCFPCFRDAPENSPCIIRPELCEAHLGKGRDPEWEERNHNQPH